ncbi:DUF433 domain-containing protein [Agromyces aerolatus]|uniref:DUF433 domain-containing protein n=1 Tax=Agromyces sp. LY-1074 TaxID=3074080 RepID=UPI00285FCB95|nr:MULTISPECIES: DUF433 domain-containing protein [unclassified Agromyces]MDR5701163.1 DUF433 domain-containing protein [Agromyces sp. LY-1074]MDR5707803.1 DUF433 domain-containing protein [Agromyces sp. LY-1358]
MIDRALGREYLIPTYSQADVAQIIRASSSTVQRWATGYGTATRFQRPLISGVQRGHGLTVPFIGLAEAFVLNAFRKAGLPMQRIRPAVEVLKSELGIEYALASNRLLTDGAEILYRTEDPLDRRLIVVRNHHAVFTEVVEDYLRHIDFGPLGYADQVHLPQYPGLDVSVRPNINGGQPTLTGSGVPVDAVLGRVRAGEPPTDVAVDYNLSHEDVLNLNRLAA